MKKQKRTHKWMTGDLVCIKQTFESPEFDILKWAEDYSLGIVLRDDDANPDVEFKSIRGFIESYYLNDSSLTMISEQEFENDNSNQ